MVEQLRQRAARTWQHFMGDSLYRNSIFLIINMGFSALAGFLFWTINARLFDAEAVGYATALVSALGLAATFSSLGFNKTVVRFLTKSTNQNQLLVTKMYLSTGAALLSALVLAFWMPKLGITHPSGLVVAVFALSAVVISLKTLVDSIFIAHRAARQTLIENSVSNVAKLTLPFVCMSFGYMGIFVSYSLAALLALLTAVFILRRKFQFKARTRPAVQSLTGLWSFSLGSYAADIVGALPTLVLPLIITAKVGPAIGAYWYMAMMVATFLFMLCSSINQSLFAEAAHDEAALLRHVRKAALAMVGIVVPLAVLLSIIAPTLLLLFGPEYQQATDALRLLLLSSVLIIGNYIAGSILNIYGKVGYLTLVNAVNAAIVIAGSLLFVHSLTGFGWVWLAGEVANVSLFGLGAGYVLRNGTLPQPKAGN